MLVALAPAASGLLWQYWDGDYIVYQISSGETHLFNETTALMLERLGQGPASLADVRQWIVETLSITEGGLSIHQLAAAAGRLDELGLVEWVDEVPNPL